MWKILTVWVRPIKPQQRCFFIERASRLHAESWAKHSLGSAEANSGAGMKQGRICCVWQGSRQHAMTYLDERETAVHNYEQMLELNPDDNQAIRYLLGLYYLDLGQTMACEKLLYQYSADTTTFHTYNRALCTFIISGDGVLS